jgi:hypothetical protein
LAGAGYETSGALAPEQRQQQDDGQRNTQQPKQRASTETHDLSSSVRCVRHQRFAAFWVPLEIGGDVLALGGNRYPAPVTTAAVVAGRSKAPRSAFTTSIAAIKVTAAVTAPNVNPMKRRLDSSAMGRRLGLLVNLAEQRDCPCAVPRQGK